MSRSTIGDSYWDSLPREVVLDVCNFLSALDLLNISAAYPSIEQLVMDTRNLWRLVHLPFPDPLLHNYPGWQKNIPVGDRPSSMLTDSNSERVKSNDQRGVYTAGSRMAIFQDDRFRFLSEPDYFDLPDIEGGEHDNQNENTAWIILDVLDKIPLQHVRHLSFGCPPCHLCVYPCNETCECECHQNEQIYGATNHGPLGGIERNPLAPLSQPLQDLFESGMVDFSQHIDLRSLDEALTMESAINHSAQGYSGGISNQSHSPNEQNHPLSPERQPHFQSHVLQDTRRELPLSSNLGSSAITSSLDESDLQDALQQLRHMEDGRQNRISQQYSRQSEPDADGTMFDEENRLADNEEVMEQQRQHSETRAAYQRARLLIRVLSLTGLDTLETLRAPWWPAARIYTIRQQLERWSFMIEQVQDAASANETTDTENGDGVLFWTAQAAEASQNPPSSRTNVHPPLVPWQARWTNSRTDVKAETQGEQSGEDRAVLSQGCSKSTIPLPSLSRFTLRSGGEVVSHERRSIEASALILSGRSSAASSLASTPPRSSNPTTTIVIPEQSSPVSASSPESAAAQSASSLLMALSSSYTPIFRYCHRCGSQYLQAVASSNTCSRSHHRTCFCGSSREQQP